MRKMTQDIHLEQQQKLYMTTELRQAISVLQMSSLELCEYITKSMEENPFLDDDASTDGNDEGSEDGNSNKVTNVVALDKILDSYQEFPTSHIKSDNHQENTFERYLSNTPSLYEHLTSQLNIELRHPRDIFIGNYLIGNIDSNGYLVADLADVSSRMNVSISQVEDVLKVIQNFHPPGIGARDLKECLLLQIRYLGKDNALVNKIIQEYLKELAEKKFLKIAEILKVKVTKIQEIYDFITKLNPRPGLQYGTSRNSFIWPDVTLIKEGDKYQVLVNDQDFSYLRINRVYINLLKESNNLSDDARRYLEEKLESALGLIRGIEQRRINIFKVVQSIVEIQSDFLDNGIECLRPLTMSTIADMLDIHESTVSRVTSNKYIQTPRGLFSLKYFFGSGITSQNSDLVCSKSVKHLIQDIINNENPNQPLSDQQVMHMLVNKGINISRRTVNKYRQSIGIPTNTLRKRYDN